MSENKTFLMISMPVIGVFDDPQNLFDEVFWRPYPAAEVSCLNTMEEANKLAFQKYGISFYGRQQDGTSRPMSLPVNGAYILSPLATEAEKQNPGGFTNMPSAHPADFGGVWGISATNGFGAGFGLSDMVSTLMQVELVYPVARWFTNYPDSFVWAQGDYVRRFYSRFLGTSIAPRIPSPTQMLPGRIFVDAEYASNEKNRIESEFLARFLSHGLLA